MGRRSAELILQLIAGDANTTGPVVLGFELVARQSTAAPGGA
jgi:DNA-binding LacI/PurR family transcriptional regulator